MAKLSGNIQFTGKLGGVHAYKLKGSEDIILRQNGGPSRETLANSDSCVNVRRSQGEFGGRSTTCKLIRTIMNPVSNLAGINVSSNLQTVVTVIQKMDTTSEWGKRGVPFSLGRNLLEGYQVNKVNTFDSVIRQPLHYSIDRTKCAASIVLPDLVPGINFNCPWKVSLFRFVITLGILPDMEYDAYKFKPVQPVENRGRFFLKTDWLPVTLPFTGSTITIEPPERIPVLHETHSLVLSIGVEGGNWITNTLVQSLPYAGCGKIMAVG